MSPTYVRDPVNSDMCRNSLLTHWSCDHTTYCLPHGFPTTPRDVASGKDALDNDRRGCECSVEKTMLDSMP
jgi:hypothetical protein